MSSGGSGRSSSGSAAGAFVSSSSGAAANMYERLVRAVLGRDAEASARAGAQETVERLLRILHSQSDILTVRCKRVALHPCAINSSSVALGQTDG